MAERVGSQIDAPVDDPPRNAGVLAVAALVTAVLAWIFLALALAAMEASTDEIGVHWIGQSAWLWIAIATGVLSLVLAVRALARSATPGTPGRLLRRLLASLSLVAIVVFALVTAVLMVGLRSETIEGRRNRSRSARRRRHPDLRTEPAPSGDRLDTEAIASLPDDVLDELHDMWSRAAHFEAEAVAAFDQLAEDLASLGAPDELVSRARAAAREEVEHAATSRAIASLFDTATTDVSVSEQSRLAPGATPAPRSIGPRRCRIARLAVASYLDGCCNEGAEVQRLALAASRSDPTIARSIHTIMEQERSHAELGWATIDWASDEIGPAIRWALRAIRFVPSFASGTGDSRDPAVLERWGWVSSAERASCAKHARVASHRRLMHGGEPAALHH